MYTLVTHLHIKQERGIELQSCFGYLRWLNCAGILPLPSNATNSREIYTYKKHHNVVQQVLPQSVQKSMAPYILPSTTAFQQLDQYNMRLAQSYRTAFVRPIVESLGLVLELFSSPWNALSGIHCSYTYDSESLCGLGNVFDVLSLSATLRTPLMAWGNPPFNHSFLRKFRAALLPVLRSAPVCVLLILPQHYLSDFLNDKRLSLWCSTLFHIPQNTLRCKGGISNLQFCGHKSKISGLLISNFPWFVHCDGSKLHAHLRKYRAVLPHPTISKCWVRRDPIVAWSYVKLLPDVQWPSAINVHSHTVLSQHQVQALIPTTPSDFCVLQTVKEFYMVLFGSGNLRSAPLPQYLYYLRHFYLPSLSFMSQAVLQHKLYTATSDFGNRVLTQRAKLSNIFLTTPIFLNIQALPNLPSLGLFTTLLNTYTSPTTSPNRQCVYCICTVSTTDWSFYIGCTGRGLGKRLLDHYYSSIRERKKALRSYGNPVYTGIRKIYRKLQGVAWLNTAPFVLSNFLCKKEAFQFENYLINLFRRLFPSHSLNEDFIPLPNTLASTTSPEFWFFSFHTYYYTVVRMSMYTLRVVGVYLLTMQLQYSGIPLSSNCVVQNVVHKAITHTALVSIG